MSNYMIFVDGELYDGPVIYDCYKGVGWKNGRPAAVEINVPTCSEVVLVDMYYKKVRKLYLSKREYNTLERHGKIPVSWNVQPLAQDE